MAISDELDEEARAFDERIEDRIQGGHLPDLRRAEACDYFYNNPWRRPYLAAMDFGRAFQFARSHAKPGRLLEIGCGVGHMSLEFARNGFHVTGVDLSGKCLEVAKRVLAENPYQDGFGSVTYVQDDVLSWNTSELFDTVCFFGCLHHIEALDRTLDRVKALLKPEGRIIVCEPARDWITEKNAAVVVLIRTLLSLRGLWYAPQPLPLKAEELQGRIEDSLIELQEGRDTDEAKQSPHDNDSAAEGMLAALRSRFKERELRRINGYLQRVIGGVRGASEEEARRIAEFLDLFDRAAIQAGVIEPGEMYWAGE